ncbi:hypothetical protein [Mucilaginibacter sp. UR6-11]|uniref:hypothetical protein n=1 Tax=Mucilaginibacter sp. UR6-11 TaxID=1435644 RepID=UPI001E5579FD|nr:hypothetical protein [Mucilaginibacter sp. UR6-11]MCC8424241.1 hypothetical protein [Mucilaginibacter sp. UR6-11]
MKKFKRTPYKLLWPALLFSISVSAQKLPGIQKNSLRAPANIKVDGKAKEWGNKLQAYNRSIQAFYTIANDDNKLYLTVQATKKEIINKIINGGVSFTVGKAAKKTTVGGITVTYPVFDMQDRPVINLNAFADIVAGSNGAEKRADSLMKTNNENLAQKSKFIRLTGLKDLDTLTSIYNTDGIKVANAFDNKMVYTVEMSIELKLLGMSAKDQTHFNYNIRFNEIQIDFVPGIMITRNEDGTIALMNVVNSKLANSYISALSTTDCWGEYTLAK